MKLLLDTNVFIWLNDAPQRVRAQVMTIIANSDNDLFLSLTSIWELQIKIQLGKLQLSDALPDILRTQQVDNNLQILTINLSHIWALENLPYHHRDPFDRLLIAQAQIEGMTLVSADGMFELYDVDLLW
ncbi:type II toxin-antitoxin system VapC family toxin [Chamaesiphon sp. GL140_3_metabinner_50]|uniref:type II toxin-antitoxin system VapC family toxin n=1 Tax=Chamaesiphon sp. GL140_3_metabinner_50 TaxID=2970812 RepID=UPI0025EF2FA3|nr:type II toxin-antitoxin system VapC family toxin [Chamaesiphon sp. GL140_3_metabinner_50]